MRIFLIVLLLLLICGCASRQSSVDAQRSMATSSSQRSVQRIAFGSCAGQYNPQPIWDRIAARRPDLFLFLGDTIYADWDGTQNIEVTPEVLKDSYAELGAHKEFQRFRKQIPIMAVWDDHDYGKNDGGKEFALKDVSQSIFLDFFKEPADSRRRLTPGIHDARMVGERGRRVQIILLDTRYFRDALELDTRSEHEKEVANVFGRYRPTEDKTRTVLGDAQWRWLEQELQKEAELRIIASSIQVISREKGTEAWGNFPHELERLVALVSKVNGVVFISGDVHFAELSKSDEGSYPLYDLTSSNLAQVQTGWSRFVNRYRVGKAVEGINFGILEIDWNTGVLHLIIANEHGDTALQHQVSLATLQPK